MPKKAITEPPRADRDAKGRLLPGHSVGALGGRPKGIDLGALLRRTRNVEEDVAGVGAKLLELAMAGDTQAARLILDRLLGKVKDEVSVEHKGRTQVVVVTGVPDQDPVADDDDDLLS